ncbi:hypothetical protein HMPREF0501_00465 [Limosilactobacillus coleohominis 101-4-CHN]|uniref:Uncharacterized protein n=1 Tax=Limosilactobacillus coleohominis 101-4-CHN TaxID=575594 RepID=C7XUU9_9LACO|nr:hypothetical protein HMPREF0501_00465 [Limosilactobacillus coleohominis 101-4-CHN]
MGDGEATYLGRNNGIVGNKAYWTPHTKSMAEIFTESELEDLKKENPKLAPAMKEPVDGDNE